MPGGFLSKFHPTFKEKIMPISHKPFQSTKKEGVVSNRFDDASNHLETKIYRDAMRRENHRPIPLVNMDTYITYIFNKILMNGTQQYIKKATHHSKWDLSFGCKVGIIWEINCHPLYEQNKEEKPCGHLSRCRKRT